MIVDFLLLLGALCLEVRAQCLGLDWLGLLGNRFDLVELDSHAFILFGNQQLSAPLCGVWKVSVAFELRCTGGGFFLTVILSGGNTGCWGITFCKGYYFDIIDCWILSDSQLQLVHNCRAWLMSVGIPCLHGVPCMQCIHAWPLATNHFSATQKGWDCVVQYATFF